MCLGDLAPLYQQEADVEGERPQEGGEKAANSEAGDDVGEAVGLYCVNISEDLTKRESLEDLDD